MACMRREKNDEMNSNVKNKNINVGWQIIAATKWSGNKYNPKMPTKIRFQPKAQSQTIFPHIREKAINLYPFIRRHTWETQTSPLLFLVKAGSTPAWGSKTSCSASSSIPVKVLSTGSVEGPVDTSGSVATYLAVKALPWVEGLKALAAVKRDVRRIAENFMVNVDMILLRKV